MGPLLTTPPVTSSASVRTRGSASRSGTARPSWRERRQDARLRKELAARPQNVRNELLEMLSRQV